MEKCVQCAGGVLSVVDFLQEVNVYGVPVPGAEECTALGRDRGLFQPCRTQERAAVVLRLHVFPRV